MLKQFFLCTDNGFMHPNSWIYKELKSSWSVYTSVGLNRNYEKALVNYWFILCSVESEKYVLQ